MAISNYDPRWLDVLRDAGTREIVMPFDEMRLAHGLRQKLYRLREDMEREKHPYHNLAARVAMSCVYVDSEDVEYPFINYTKTPPPKNLRKKDPVLLRLRPQDLKFADVLEKAGYKIPDLES